MCVINQAVERMMRSRIQISLLLFATWKGKYTALSLNPVTVVLWKQFNKRPHYVGVASLSIFWGNFVLAKVCWELIKINCGQVWAKLIVGRCTESVCFSDSLSLEVLMYTVVLRIQIQSHSRFMKQIPGYIEQGICWTRRTLPVVKMRLWLLQPPYTVSYCSLFMPLLQI